MIVPLSQLINALHSLKNSATASIQTLHKDFIPEHSSHLNEVRRTPRILGMIPQGGVKKCSTVSNLLVLLLLTRYIGQYTVNNSFVTQDFD